MSNYEFWDELGKIFNAVVAYQEKSIEFNKRFINPWIRIGNVFDKQDRNNEAVSAYQKAIELDPDSAQNWSDLGNVYFRMEKYDEAVEAYNKAIELDSASGWSYNNLALTYASQGRYDEAIPLYLQSADLLVEDADKAVAWNRLGNAYRKLNQYERAVAAFQKADELDGDNAGFRDDLDDVAESLAVADPSRQAADQDNPVRVSPIQLILAESQQVEEAASENTQQTAVSADSSTPAALMESAQAAQVVTAPDADNLPAASADEASASDVVPTTSQVEAAPASAISAIEMQASENNVLVVDPAATEIAAANITVESSVDTQVPEPPAEAPANVTLTQENSAAEVLEPAEAASLEPTIVSEDSSSNPVFTVMVQTTVETYTESPAVPNTAIETSEVAALASQVTETPAAEATEDFDDENSDAADVSVEAEPDSEDPGVEAVEDTDEVELQESGPEVEEYVVEQVETEETVETVLVQTVDDNALPSENAAYDEFLKDNKALDILTSEAAEESVETEAALREPIAKIDSSGDLEIEMDTKNAHVWNELGNVYFNSCAYDDAIIAYSKAIELDRRFAWPYSNLALTYVQKARFAEAILLYQRSIELFTGEKDKAISWNRLGNVYRRLNDYDNAISAYQRADELDPDNTTLSMRSRFSLLGNYYVEQRPNYIS